MKTIGVVLGVTLLFCSSIASGQPRGFGLVQGKVVDNTGAPLTDVVFVASQPGTSGTVSGLTDKEGRWKLFGLARGDWNVVFEKSGYSAARAKITLESELTRMPQLTITLRTQR